MNPHARNLLRHRELFADAEDDWWITMPEATHLTGFHRNRIYRLVAAGKIRVQYYQQGNSPPLTRLSATDLLAALTPRHKPMTDKQLRNELHRRRELTEQLAKISQKADPIKRQIATIDEKLLAHQLESPKPKEPVTITTRGQRYLLRLSYKAAAFSYKNELLEHISAEQLAKKMAKMPKLPTVSVECL